MKFGNFRRDFGQRKTEMRIQQEREAERRASLGQVQRQAEELAAARIQVIPTLPSLVHTS